MALTNNSFVGEYERRPVENLYHKVTIEIKDNQLIWRNKCVSWPLQFYDNKLWKRNEPEIGQKLGFWTPGRNGQKSSLKSTNDTYPAQELKYEVGPDRKIRAVIFYNEAYHRTSACSSNVPYLESTMSGKSLKEKLLGKYERHPIKNG